MALKLHIHEDDYTLIQEKVAICMESSIGIKFVKLRAYFWHGARSAWFLKNLGHGLSWNWDSKLRPEEAHCVFHLGRMVVHLWNSDPRVVSGNLGAQLTNRCFSVCIFLCWGVEALVFRFWALIICDWPFHIKCFFGIEETRYIQRNIAAQRQWNTTETHTHTKQKQVPLNKQQTTENKSAI